MEGSSTRPHVVFRGAGSDVAVGAGGVLGRLGTADLRIADPRVSELHGLVSLRGRELHLLALRGALRVDGTVVDDVLLVPGLQVGLAEGITLDVVRVYVPDTVLVFVDGDGPSRELCAPVYSWVGGEVVDRYEPAADAHLWSAADGYWHARRGEAPSLVTEGTEFGRMRVARVPVDAVGVAHTTAVAPPLRLVVRTTTVHIHRPRQSPVGVDGLPGRLLSEVALLNSPAPWTAVAQALWPGVRDRVQLRELWDRTTRRLRERLRECGVREDLVRSDGRGNIELFRHLGDQVVDEA